MASVKFTPEPVPGVFEMANEQDHVHSEACISCGLDFDFEMPEGLVEIAHRGNLVVFAGAGVSTEVPAVFPTTFYEDAQDRLESTGDPAFPELMQAFEDRFGRQELLRSLKRRFNYVDSFPTLRNPARSFHRELATMPYLRDVITTNWDTYFEEECWATPFVGGADFAFHDMPGRRVYKIHGSMTNLSSIVITEQDYQRRLETLRDDALGGALRQMLATKAVVFVGYSLRDWNFRRLYDALRADMGALAPRAYFVSPFPSEAADELALITIQTSGRRFLSDLKSAMVQDHFIPDEMYAVIDRTYDQLEEAMAIVGEFSHRDYPAIAHCWGYQQGLRDALGRILSRRGSGEYSDRHRLTSLANSYDEMSRKALARDDYFEAAYIDGYENGLVQALAFDDEEMVNLLPLFFVYGADSEMRTREDLAEALVHSRRRAPKARAQAKLIAARAPEGMLIVHAPFLADAPSSEW